LVSNWKSVEFVWNIIAKVAYFKRITNNIKYEYSKKYRVQTKEIEMNVIPQPTLIPNPIAKPHLDNNCKYCKIKFGWFISRRHHCRSCGESVCGQCSSIRDASNIDSRICKEQFSHICIAERFMMLDRLDKKD
jgi:hypothetical protein